MALQSFFGKNKLHYGRCESYFVKPSIHPASFLRIHPYSGWNCKGQRTGKRKIKNTLYEVNKHVVFVVDGDGVCLQRYSLFLVP